MLWPCGTYQVEHDYMCMYIYTVSNIMALWDLPGYTWLCVYVYVYTVSNIMALWDLPG